MPELVAHHNERTGTVEYEGRPERAWDFRSHDPTARCTLLAPGKVPFFAQTRQQDDDGFIDVRLGENDSQTFHSVRPLDAWKDWSGVLWALPPGGAPSSLRLCKVPATESFQLASAKLWAVHLLGG